jgi:hypothetical protein
MNALAILTDARDHGVKVTVDGDKLILEGDITPEMVASFKANKPEILKLLTTVPATVEATDVPNTMAMDGPMNAALGVICDDCGRPTPVALVTSYGGRFCRECVFPAATTTSKAPTVQSRATDGACPMTFPLYGNATKGF